MSTKKKTKELKALSPGELAILYEVCRRTMNRWLKPHSERIGKREGRFYSVKQVEVIFEILGLPKDYDEAA